MKIIKDFGNEVIERTKKHREQDKSEKPDLLSRFIDYAEQQVRTHIIVHQSDFNKLSATHVPLSSVSATE